MGVMRPELVMKSIVPVVMAGVLGIYGLIIAVIISTGSKQLCGSNLVVLQAFVLCCDQLCLLQKLISHACCVQSTSLILRHTIFLMDTLTLRLVCLVVWLV